MGRPSTGHQYGGRKTDRPVCLVLVHQADQVAGVAHLAEEEGHDAHPPLLLVEAADDLRLADAVLADEHDVLLRRREPEDFEQLLDVDANGHPANLPRLTLATSSRA